MDPIHAQRLEWLVEWNCCGHRFELLLDTDYPEQHHWSPICPSCHAELAPALVQWRDRRRFLLRRTAT
jgi:hypothetical protein